ncbi:MAG TPA: hypothetical protein VEL03_16560 [Streptosporangiaceae bacterium]|nr:hypothetical protein [Streptosporangiaceae bacterium]
MFVIRLANGNLLVPDSAVSTDGRVLGDAYVEIGPDDAEYLRLAEEAVTQEECDERRERWRAGDEDLHREFLDYLARHGADGGWSEGSGGGRAGGPPASDD